MLTSRLGLMIALSLALGLVLVIIHAVSALAVSLAVSLAALVCVCVCVTKAVHKSLGNIRHKRCKCAVKLSRHAKDYCKYKPYANALIVFSQVLGLPKSFCLSSL
jgi:hypothetical protein